MEQLTNKPLYLGKIGSIVLKPHTNDTSLVIFVDLVVSFEIFWVKHALVINQITKGVYIA